MQRTFVIIAAMSFALAVPATFTVASAADQPTLEQRVADVEAYINNGGRTPDVPSKVPGPGPGHNAWMMTASALVLFMTLPGLALFYGGLAVSYTHLTLPTKRIV